MRIVLYFAAILFAVVLMAGCKKDVSVVPTVHQTVKIASADSTSLDGGKNDPLHPPH